MMLEFLETGKALYALAAICCLGLLTRLTARNLYKRLMRETDNMTLTKNRFLRDLKQKAENSYRLNGGIANTQAYLERQLSNCRFLGLTLDGWANVSSQLTILCFLFGGMASFASYWYRCDNYYIVMYGTVGILMGLFTLFVDCGVNLPERRSQLIGSLQDYLENSLFYRLERENTQTEEAKREVARSHNYSRIREMEKKEDEEEAVKERPERVKGRQVKKTALAVSEKPAEEPPVRKEAMREVDYIKQSLEQIAASKERTRPDRNWMKELSEEELTVVGQILRQYLT